MARRILDTSILIRHWQRHFKTLSSIENATRLANDLVAIHDTKAIVTPVYIEFVAGTRTALDLEYSRAYLARLEIVDGGRILKEDWEKARQIAERVPRNGKPRQLGDCLIRAIAARLKYDVQTVDDSFPH
ncbi:MAG TPA: PIN domain-containing protein [Pirellulales bacterium]|nr:PIN domain-containing protein [Pirellulales bacterium]